MSAERWLDELRDAESLADDIQVEVRGGGSSVGDASWRAAVRRKLGRLGKDVEHLGSRLIELELEGAQVSQREMQRRQQLVEKLRVRKSELTRELAQLAEAEASFHEAHDFQGLDTYQHLAAHQRLMKEQDEGLDLLGESLVRQRRVGERIGQEADESTALLERMHGQTDMTRMRVERENERIEHFSATENKCACGMWVLIALLAVILIVLLATDGGCLIVMSKAKCAADNNTISLDYYWSSLNTAGQSSYY